MPSTAQIQIVAAVVSPVTCPMGSRKITPAPRTPTPVRMPWTTRVIAFGSKLPEGFGPSAKSVAIAAPRQTRAWVRNPAALPCSSRFKPRTEPRTNAAPRRNTVCSFPPSIKKKNEPRSQELKDNNHVEGGGELVAVRGIVERSRAGKGAVETHLWSNRQAGDRLWRRRLDIQTEGEGAIGGAATANSARINRRLARQKAHRVVVIGKRHHVKSFVGAEDFAAKGEGEPAVERV